MIAESDPAWHRRSHVRHQFSFFPGSHFFRQVFSAIIWRLPCLRLQRVSAPNQRLSQPTKSRRRLPRTFGRRFEVFNSARLRSRFEMERSFRSSGLLESGSSSRIRLTEPETCEIRVFADLIFACPVEGQPLEATAVPQSLFPSIEFGDFFPS